MFLGSLVFITALIISAVAIFYSVAGLAAIFASAVVPIVIMGGALEAGKLVTAVWLHRYWNQATWWLKTYLTLAVLVLMFITSMGIFGFLSKAHIEQTTIAGDNSLQVQLIDQRIEREQKRIKDADLVTAQLDQAVQVLLDANRIRGQNGAITTREAQREERDALNSIIDDAQKVIATLQEEKLVLQKEQIAIEAEVGPIKYIAEFVYGEKADKDMLENAVRWVIIVLIFVFDPLAVLLLIASQYTFIWHREQKAKALAEAQTLAPVVEKEEPTLDKPVQKMHEAAEEPSAEQQVTSPHPPGWMYTTPLAETIAAAQQLTPAPEPKLEEVPVEKKDTESLAESRRLTEEELDALDEDEDWKEAKHNWKDAHPYETLKHQKELYLNGVIDELPWAQDVKKKKYIVKENAVQIQKTTEE
jgi:hypothetical protein